MTAPASALKAIVVTPEDSKAIKPFGLDMQVLLSTESTGGTIAVVMACHKPGEGPPDHLHYTQEECFFVVEGTYELTVDNRTSTVGPGSIVFIPRGVTHRFKNVGATLARMLDWSVPGGQDRYFTAISELAAGGGFSGEKVMEISKQFDTNFPTAH